MTHAKLIDDNKMQLASTFVNGPPYAEWKKLRAECPVYFCEPEGFRPFWAITKYDDIMEVETNPDVFIAGPRSMVLPIDFENYMAEKFGSVNEMLRMLIQMDGKEHMRHRMLIQPWLTPKALKQRHEAIEKICNTFYNQLREKGREGSIDFAKDFVYRYPLRVICGLMGLPEEDDNVVLEMSEAMSRFERPPEGTEEVSGFEQQFAYFGKVVEDRKKNPQDDLATFIAHMELDGQPLGMREMLSYFVVLGSAGHDTTVSSILGGVKALIEHPEQLEMLRQDRSLLHGAVEEILRYVSPVVQFCRTAAEDYIIRGQKISKGDSVVIYFPSGNRDDEIYEDANTFNILRPVGRHLAFGAGPHTCMGNHLAPIEIKRFLTNLLDRFEHLELAGPTPYVAAHLVSRMASMPVNYRFRD